MIFEKTEVGKFYEVKKLDGTWTIMRLVEILPAKYGLHTHYRFYNAVTGRYITVKSLQKIQPSAQAQELLND